MSCKNAAANARSPLAVLTIVLVMTWAVLAGMSCVSYRFYHNAQATTHRGLKIEQLRGSITHLDEVLTMSARMAALTGDPQWENRYRRFEPQLDAALKEAMRLAPETYSGEAAAETDEANKGLVEMEKHAFDLVRQRRTEEAKAVLSSDEYESQKQVYAKGIDAFAAALTDAVATTLKQEQRLAFLKMGTIVLVMLLLIVGWVAVFRAVQDWKTTLVKQANVLAEVNKSLDQKVVERTDVLKNEIAERKRMDGEVRRLAMIAEQAVEGIAVADLEGKIQFVNQAWTDMHGYDSGEDLVGERLSIFHTEEQLKTEVISFNEEVKRIGHNVGEVGHKRRDGTTFPAMMTVTLLKDEQGMPYALAGFLQDITNRKQAERQIQDHATSLESKNQRLEELNQAAEAANCAKSEFLANMSHELRTPMTAILGFAETLLTEGEIAEAPPQRIQALRIIIRNGEHLLTLIDGILNLSKIEAGKLDLEHVRFSPSSVALDVLSLMRIRAEAKGLSLELEFIGKIPETIYTDPARLRQILINLIGNAIKFTEAGDVRLVARLLDSVQDDPKMQFSVVDSGIGLAEEDIARLFEPFEQADTTTTRKFGGTGLGLTISRRIAKKLGGDVVVESALGEGSTFTLTVSTGALDGIGLIDGPSDIQLPAESVKTPAATNTKLDCRVLLAEDGLDNQRLIAFLLNQAEAEVVVADNGQTAYDLALARRDEGTPFDVILMDMQMPVMDGYEATRRLREVGYTGPIIALTAHAMSTDRDKCLNAGCDDHMAKPINREKLMSLVAECASWQVTDNASHAPVA